MGSETMTCKLRSPVRKVREGGPSLAIQKKVDHNGDVSIQKPSAVERLSPRGGEGYL
jgi:hypothetical protein